MSKELEAFERIKIRLNCYLYNEYKKEFDLIENALKDYETLKTSFFLENVSIVDNKKLKALEVIKKKRVNVWAIYITKNVDEYNFSIVNEVAKKLTKKEYELLREELL